MFYIENLVESTLCCPRLRGGSSVATPIQLSVILYAVHVLAKRNDQKRMFPLRFRFRSRRAIAAVRAEILETNSTQPHVITLNRNTMPGYVEHLLAVLK